MTFPISRQELQAIREKHADAEQPDVEVDAVIEYMSNTILEMARVAKPMSYQFWSEYLRTLPGCAMTKPVAPYMKEIRTQLRSRFPDVTFDMDRAMIYMRVDWSY
jgi:hypothetical protein